MAGPRYGRMGGLTENEKPKNFKGTLRRLVADFKPYRGPLIFVAIIITISVVFTLLSPLYIRNILNDIIANPALFFDEVDGFLRLKWVDILSRFGIIVGFYFFSHFFTWLSEFLLIPISNRYSYKIRQAFQAKMDRLPLSFFDRQTYGEILSKGTNDVDSVSRSLQGILSSVLSSLFMFVGTLVMMFITSWQLTLVALAILPLSLSVTIFIAKNSQKRFKAYYAKLGMLNGLIEENYSGYKIVKLFNKENETVKTFRNINTDLAKADRMSQFFSGIIFPAINFVNNLGFVGIAVVGGLINNIGNMVAFFILVGLFQRPFQMLGQISNIIQSSIAAAERIFKIMDEPELPASPKDAIESNKNIKGKIEFKKVAFAYKPEQPLFTGLDLQVNQGDTIAIVGPTGAGKTTLVNLMMRFYEIQQGEILLDGINLKQYSYPALRTAFGMVLQDTWLFKGTIRENIRYGKEDATDAEVEAAAKAALAHFFISTLPDGYDFMLNEDGTNISQGQRQLLTIARAILIQPKMLILDEATSSVDTRTEASIQSAMTSLMKGRTSFVIAHRLSTIKSAKLILVMKNGSIVETGNHESLLKQKGFYAELYNAQFTGNNQIDTT
ncbi:MAG: ABC transporter ATP-binding protein, partial [Bacilli bacterium]